MIGLILAAAWGYGTVNFDGWPPQRYTRDTTAFVHFIAPQFVSAKCDLGRPDPLHPTEACSFGPPNEIYIPNPCDFAASDNYARLLCHEIAHIAPNNWPDTHPR